MYLIAYLRTYYRIITDRRMIYKKDSEKKTRGKGANGAQRYRSRMVMIKERIREDMKAAMRAHDGRCRWGAARNLLIEGP